MEETIQEAVDRFEMRIMMVSTSHLSEVQV